MDNEDRDHFKTMSLALERPQADSRQSSNEEPSDSRLDQAYCLGKAKAICGCYRRDEAHDPETFAAALALVLTEFPKSVVDYVADARTGVSTVYRMGLPQVGQIEEFCEQIEERQRRLQRPAEPIRHYVSPPQPILPGQVDSTMFLKLVAEGKTRARPIGRFETADDQWNRGSGVMAARGGDLRNADLMALNQRAFERECATAGIDPARGVSPSLLKTLGGEQ